MADKREAVILVRIDDMTTFSTIGQRSIRFELDDAAEDVNAAVAAALKQAPPVDEWQGF
jgi:hypothetical protein